jgi:very-short-patch-repair endonuclease
MRHGQGTARRWALTPRGARVAHWPSPKFGRGPTFARTQTEQPLGTPTERGMGRRLHNSTYRARSLRRSSTPAECVLWEHLRDRRLDGVKFRRQHAIGRYYADFCAVEMRLIVEADGAHHFPRTDHDRARDEWLREAGYVVLRLPNREILEDIDAALERIRTAIRRASLGL